MKYSPWSYNETVAQDFHPRTREEALELGARWEESMPGTFGKGTIKPEFVSDNINEILNAKFAKEITKSSAKNLRFIKNSGFLCRGSVRRAVIARE